MYLKQVRKETTEGRWSSVVKKPMDCVKMRILLCVCVCSSLIQVRKGKRKNPKHCMIRTTVEKHFVERNCKVCRKLVILYWEVSHVHSSRNQKNNAQKHLIQKHQ